MKPEFASCISLLLSLLLTGCGDTSDKETVTGMDEARKAGTTAPYGEWESPVSAQSLTRGASVYSELLTDNDSLYWLESRPEEGGRYVIMVRDADGDVRQLTPEGYNVRTRVQEYGGGAYLVHDGTLWFANFDDQRWYRQEPGKDPVPITPETSLRYAECRMDAARGRLICVREDHRGGDEPRNELVSIDPAPREAALNEGTVLFSGTDFVSSAALSPDGGRLAFITWNHPDMPWDNVQLRLAHLDQAGAVQNLEVLNSGREEAVVQPGWVGGDLFFVSDRDNWWNFYRYRNGDISRVNDDKLELAGPAWQLGTVSWAPVGQNRIVSYVNEQGREGLAAIDLDEGALQIINVPLVAVQSLISRGDMLFVSAGFSDRSPGIVRIDAAAQSLETLRGAGDTGLAPETLSRPENISFEVDGGERAYGFYYPPANAEFRAPSGETPPLIVTAHGGPTGHTTPAFRKKIQFWTSRGFAVFDLNYRGSTGFGRDYRQALYGRWGVADVDDAVAAARYLVAHGKADDQRLIVRGGSAGGYLVLSSLAFRDTFKAGANYYGVSDIEALAKHTHKFESRYLDRLVGPYPERRDIYLERSPVNHLEGFTEPLITFQGLEDEVVPPEQSERIVEALRDKGIPVAYLTFPGEQHGFRRAENIIRSHEAELYFYGQIFGFDPAGEQEPVIIDNF